MIGRTESLASDIAQFALPTLYSSPEFSGERIPTLQEAVELCRELDLSIILDVKSNRRKVTGQNTSNPLHSTVASSTFCLKLIN